MWLGGGRDGVTSGHVTSCHCGKRVTAWHALQPQKSRLRIPSENEGRGRYAESAFI